ncbi:tetratricopeptide repeat protein [Candidatus Ferrigenium straubiae]|uniref:tetratricopeptide repeat protein n=1 Tax=Candidatus Ferrigenium straubiae TaxID=2919506 RepID=UPI003F4AA60B
MSVINQVLNQLEQRGEHTPPEQTMVRPVPQHRRSLVLPLLAVILVLVVGIAAWQWTEMRKPGAVAVNPMQRQPAASASAAGPVTASAVAAPEPVSAVPAAGNAGIVNAASSVDVVSAVGAEEIPPPASRLSFELGAIPLPSSLRPNAAAQEMSGKPPAHVRAQVARPQPAQMPDARVAIQPSGGAQPMKQVSPEQRADAEFRQAVAAMQQGHAAEAIAGYRTVLRLDAGHDEARQALVALLLENKQGAEAERALQERLTAKPGHTGFAMLLARLQVEHGAVEQAVATLEKSLPYADAQADYQAFFAALLQRRNRHKEAITHYQIALQLAPDNGVWLMGYGISLQAVQRADDARDAFRRALESRTLSPELQAFVRQKLKEL